VPSAAPRRSSRATALLQRQRYFSLNDVEGPERINSKRALVELTRCHSLKDVKANS
jgi:hypothetical protein